MENTCRRASPPPPLSPKLAPAESVIEELILWAKELGTTLHPNVQVYHDPITGLSFRAEEDIAPDTKLVNCSYGVTLSYLNAVDAPGFARRSGEAFPQKFLETLSSDEPNIIGHFFLMQQHLLRERSFWWPYVRFLPQPDAPSSIPALWPEEDQMFLEGTNAEPAIKKRNSLWQDEWTRATDILRDFQNVKLYTFSLYKWAASIYGSRSFRPSLTIPESFVPDHAEQFAKDKFSALFPVLDIGNHNGINNVGWTTDPASGTFVLSNCGSLRQNEQIFNYYGNKSNSELLVAYGFTLPSTSSLDRDVVNLKLKPETDALALRRSQRCHVIPLEADEEFMFTVERLIDRGDRRLKDFLPFSDGLIDMIICMIANPREKSYLSRHSEHCPESDPDIFSGPLGRAFLQTLQILDAKLKTEYQRTYAALARHLFPQNPNQTLAIDYTKYQLETVARARSVILPRLHAALSFSTFVENQSKAQVYDHMLDQVELLSLKHAFEWLLASYPEVHTAITEVISKDQDEPLPLDWSVLVQDWDHTYWIVWIYIVWLLWARDGEAFRLRHHQLNSWLLNMNGAYDHVVGNDILCAEASEIPTIDLIILEVGKLEQFSGASMQNWLHSQDRDVDVSVATGIRNFASYVAHEETIRADYPIPVNFSRKSAKNGNRVVPVTQKLLCITKNGVSDARGSWSTWFETSPGFR